MYFLVPGPGICRAVEGFGRGRGRDSLCCRFSISSRSTDQIQTGRPCPPQPAARYPSGLPHFLCQVPGERFYVPPPPPRFMFTYCRSTALRQRHLAPFKIKAKLKGALALRDPNISTESQKSHQFPPEIIEIIIAHLAYDAPILKACAATCSSWYNVASPHLHHTVTFR